MQVRGGGGEVGVQLALNYDFLLKKDDPKVISPIIYWLRRKTKHFHIVRMGGIHSSYNSSYISSCMWLSEILCCYCYVRLHRYINFLAYSGYLLNNVCFNNFLKGFKKDFCLTQLGRLFQTSGPWCLRDFWASKSFGLFKWILLHVRVG